MPWVPISVRIRSIRRLFRRKKHRAGEATLEQGPEVSMERRVSGGLIPRVPAGTPNLQDPLPETSKGKLVQRGSLYEATLGRSNLKRYVSEPNPRRCCSECGIAAPHPSKCLLGALIERSTPEVSIARPPPAKNASEVLAQTHISTEISCHASTRTNAATKEMARTPRRRRQQRPRATAQNNRLLALPAELRMLIYDELLAIPRTVYMFEPASFVKSHIHKIMRFDKDLFSRRGQLRYRFSDPCVGYYDPRTTTFAVRFVDDDDCTHRAWSANVYTPGQGVPTRAAEVISPADLASRPHGSYLVFPTCSATSRSQNSVIWNRVHAELFRRPEIQILEFEFSKLCSLIMVLKYLTLGHYAGWRELRKLEVLRIRLKHGNGGPLNAWEMIVLWSSASQVREEMQRKVLLKRGPRIEIAW